MPCLSYNPTILKRRSILFLFTSLLLYPLDGQETLLVDTYFISEVEVFSADKDMLLTEAQKEEIKKGAGIKKFTSIQFPLSLGDSLNQAIHRLWEKGYDVQVELKRLEGKKIILYIKVCSQSPVVNFIQWTGITAQEEDAISSRLSWYKGKIFRKEELPKACKEVEVFFHSLGYAQVDVQYSFAIDERNGVSVHFKINKKALSHVRKILFRGATKREQKLLCHQLPLYGKSEKSYRVWLRIFWRSLKKRDWDHALYLFYARFRGRQLFREELLESSLELIRNFYRSKGFLDIKVSAQTIFKRKQGEMAVVFSIEKGEQYVIRSVSWVGNQSYDEKNLTDHLSIALGQPYDPFEIEEKLNAPMHPQGVQSLYENKEVMLMGQHGYISGIEGNNVDLTMVLREIRRPILRYIQVDDQGLPPYVVRGILASHGLAPQKKFHKRHLIAAQNEMAASHLIDGEKTQMTPVQVSPDEVDLVCTVPLGHRLMQIAFNLDIKQGIDGSIALQNLDLWKLLELKIPTQGCYSVIGKVFYQWGNESKGKPIIGEIELENPFVFGYGKRYHVQCRYAYAHSLTAEDKWCQSNDLLVGIGDHTNEEENRLQKHLKLMYGGGSFSYDEDVSNQPLKRLRCTLEMQKTDVNHWFYPTQGRVLKLQGDVILPFLESVGVSIRPIATYAHYKQYGCFVWMQQGSAGINLEGGTECGQFFLGGKEGSLDSYYSLRDGYHVPLRGYAASAFFSDKKMGGTSFAYYNTELRYSYSSTGYLLIFLDVGGVGVSLFGGKIRASVGIGIKQIVPFLGILSFYVSYNLEGKFDIGFGLQKPRSF